MPPAIPVLFPSTPLAASEYGVEINNCSLFSYIKQQVQDTSQYNEHERLALDIYGVRWGTRQSLIIRESLQALSSPFSTLSSSRGTRYGHSGFLVYQPPRVVSARDSVRLYPTDSKSTLPTTFLPGALSSVPSRLRPR